MRILSTLVSFVLMASSPVAYFKYQRSVPLSAGAGQHYAVVDETIWKHARRDLADLRLYGREREIPYSLVTERGSLNRERTPVPVLQQSVVGGKTQFLVNMSGLAEYDNVELSLATRNFVAHARVEGQNDDHARRWATLGDSILYSLSKENLGNNHMLRLPRATYKYLRITIEGPVKPEDVQGATSEVSEDQPAQWRDLTSPPEQEEKGKDTIFTFDVGDNIPIDRVTFTIDPSQANFWRRVEFQDEKNARMGAGEINRIHMVRANQKIDSEDHDVEFSGNGQKIIKVIIHNGDDSPLKVTGTRLQQLERRIYFDAPGESQLTLYYGDEMLQPPVYDYARLFQRDRAAGAAFLEPEMANPLYTPRRDGRAWSERHPLVLWIAILVAVVLLGGIALRSIRAATT